MHSLPSDPRFLNLRIYDDNDNYCPGQICGRLLSIQTENAGLNYKINVKIVITGKGWSPIHKAADREVLEFYVTVELHLNDNVLLA